MGDFSLEPDRKDLIRHYTFDFFTDDNALDTSPQSVDGAISGTLASVTGTVGEAAYVEKEEEVDVGTVGDQTEFAISFWVNVGVIDKQNNTAEHRRLVTSSNLSNFITLEEDRSIRFRVPNVDTTDLTGGNVPEDTWTHVMCVYDNTNRIIYVDGSEAAIEDIGSGTAQLGDIRLMAAESSERSAFGAVDDFRVYRVLQPQSVVNDIYRIGAEHHSISKFGDAWNNEGIPYTGNNRTFAGTLGEEDDYINRTLDKLLDARHIDEADGKQLDEIGELINLDREKNENDPTYRARIKANVAASRSNGDFQSIIEILSTILDISVDEVELREGWERSPIKHATALVYLPTTAVNDSQIDNDTLKEIIDDLIMEAHRAEVHTQPGPNSVFRLKARGAADDSDEGLADSSGNGGGGLAASV